MHFEMGAPPPLINPVWGSASDPVFVSMFTSISTDLKMPFFTLKYLTNINVSYQTSITQTFANLFFQTCKSE